MKYLILIKYEGYIAKQMQQIEQFKKWKKKMIPEDINYDEIQGLRIEAKQKLAKLRPRSLEPGFQDIRVSPADISVLIIYLNARSRRSKRNEG